MDHGKLIPEFLPIWIWTDFLIKHFSGNEHLILDGLCRRVDEAPVLTSALKFYGFKRPCVIFLNISKEEAHKRMKIRKRGDDTDEYIESRLAWFEKEVVPAMTYLKHNGYYEFIEINGDQSIEDVHKDILKRIVMPD
jgi:adenylate kinase family enzyme